MKKEYLIDIDPNKPMTLFVDCKDVRLSVNTIEITINRFEERFETLIINGVKYKKEKKDGK